MNLVTWAVKWGVSHAALADLEQQIGLKGNDRADMRYDEAAVQSRVRLEATEYGVTLFRNNVGALLDVRGVPVRYGLANDTAALNKKVKSGDLIGWRERLVTPDMVGTRIAQFVSRECKRGDWSYAGSEHEVAQLKWNNIVLAAGGDAAFASGPGSFQP